MSVVVVDYGMGNLGSIANMIRKVGGESVITADHTAIMNASKIILPGVGSFDAGINNLESRGLMGILNRKVLQDRIPVLGICLGMQLMTTGSDEGVRPGLGWFKARTTAFVPSATVRIPHMGWNIVSPRIEHPLFRGMPPEMRFYFVHSYHVICNEENDILTKTRYGTDFTSGIARDNIIGVQFHPEKSHRFGMRLFSNFLGI